MFARLPRAYALSANHKFFKHHSDGSWACVGVVAVVAGGETLAAMERFGVGLDFLVARITQLGHRRFQQPGLDSGFVNAVAIEAANVVLDVFRAQEVRVFLPKLVASHAALQRFFSGERAWADDLIGIGRLRVGLSWPMASLASLPLRPLVFGWRGLPMRPLDVFGRNLLVAGLAGLGAYILRGIHWLIRVLVAGVVCSFLAITALLMARPRVFLFLRCASKCAGRHRQYRSGNP